MKEKELKKSPAKNKVISFTPDYVMDHNKPMKMCALKVMSIPYNNLSTYKTSCITNLANLLLKCPIVELNLEGCKLSDDSMEILLGKSGLQNDFNLGNLIWLNLSDNNFTKKGATNIGDFIKALCVFHLKSPEERKTQPLSARSKKSPRVNLDTTIKDPKENNEKDYKENEFFLYLNKNFRNNHECIENIIVGFDLSSELSYELNESKQDLFRSNKVFFHLFLDGTMDLRSQSSDRSKDALENLLKIKRMPIKTLSLNSNNINDEFFDKLVTNVKNQYNDFFLSMYNNDLSPQEVLRTLNKLSADKKIKVMVDFFNNDDLKRKGGSSLKDIMRTYEDIKKCFSFISFYHPKTVCKSKRLKMVYY